MSYLIGVLVLVLALALMLGASAAVVLVALARLVEILPPAATDGGEESTDAEVIAAPSGRQLQQ
jgi:hypothetical protein